MKNNFVLISGELNFWKSCPRYHQIDYTTDQQPNNFVLISGYTKQEAIEAGWTNHHGDDWICPECSQEEEEINESWKI